MNRYKINEWFEFDKNLIQRGAILTVFKTEHSVADKLNDNTQLTHKPEQRGSFLCQKVCKPYLSINKTNCRRLFQVKENAALLVKRHKLKI